MKQSLCIAIIAFGIFSCVDRPFKPHSQRGSAMIDKLDFGIEINIDGQTTVWKNSEEALYSLSWGGTKKEKPLFSHPFYLDGSTLTHYQIGFRNGGERKPPWHLQTFQGEEQLIIRFPNVNQKQHKGEAFSYLKKERSYRTPAIQPGYLPRYKASFSYSERAWRNRRNNPRLGEYRWKFEKEWLSGSELEHQTESTGYTYSYVFENPGPKNVHYELFDGELKHQSNLHFDVSDFSRKFSLALRPMSDTLYAFIENGSPPFQYEWNTGASEQYILIPEEGDEPKEFVITVTDAHGQQIRSNAIFFFNEQDENEGRVPIFVSSGVIDVRWDLLLENETETDIKIIYADATGKTFYSQLAYPNENSYFEIKKFIPFSYRGSCLDFPCPEYYVQGVAIDFRFSATLASPDGDEITIQDSKGLMPVFIEQEMSGI